MSGVNVRSAAFPSGSEARGRASLLWYPAAPNAPTYAGSMHTDSSRGIAGFTSPVLTLERDGHVATVWLDRPEKRNAMGPEFWRDLPLAMSALGDEDDLRAVVIAARGPHFTVGLDLVAMSGLASSGTEAGSDRARSTASRAWATRGQVLAMQASITAVADCPVPVIAAVHGACIGGGVDLIAACDIRLASADAYFSVRETKVAIVADLGSLQRLPRILGAGHVAELAFTSMDVPAERAAAIGLVNRLSPDRDTLLDDARVLAADIAANPPLAVRGTKAVLAAGEGRTVAEGLDYVATWNAGFLASDDLVEAMTAFIEKRPPRFTGE